MNWRHFGVIRLSRDDDRALPRLYLAGSKYAQAHLTRLVDK